MEPARRVFSAADGSVGSDSVRHEPGALASIAQVIMRGRRRRISQAQLITSLNEVAEAVSSAISMEEALWAIVERAKRVTDTDKAVLILSDEHVEHLDLDSMIVRGRRDQHPQEWWQHRMEELGDEIWNRRDSVVELHRDRDAWLLWSPVLVKDRPIGVICAINSADRPFTDMQIDFLAVLSAFAGSAIENARLAEQSRYALLASERDRIAREMHDGVVQSLFSVSLGLEVCKRLVTRDPQAALGKLDDLQEHLNASMGELRRLVYDLRSARLKELGLERAIESWIREVAEQNVDPPAGKFTVEGVVPKMSPQLETCLYRVAKECVSNVVKHAHAREFEVGIECGPESLTLVVHDDGCGFDVDEAISRNHTMSLGLSSIRERVERAGGRLSIASAPTSGTTILVEFNGLGGT